MERESKFAEVTVEASGMSVVDGPTAPDGKLYFAEGVSGGRPGQLSRINGKSLQGNAGAAIMGLSQVWTPLGYITRIGQEGYGGAGDIGTIDIEQSVPQTAISYFEDQYWDSVGSLVHFDTAFPISDSKSGGALTVDPSTVQTSSIKKFGPSSVYAPITEFGPTMTLDYGTGIFDLSRYPTWTIEFWLMLESRPSNNTRASSFGLMSCVDYTGVEKGWGLSCGANTLMWDNNKANSPTTLPDSIRVGKWYAVCVMRSGDLVYLFEDGRMLGFSTLLPQSINPAESLGIEFGTDFITKPVVVPFGEFNGRIDEFRITFLQRYPTGGYKVPSKAFPNG